MHLVYLSGPLESTMQSVVERNINMLSLVARRIILSGCTPIVPLLSWEFIRYDPRIPTYKNTEWWIANFFKPYIEASHTFCYIIPRPGEICERLTKEKELWMAMGKTEFVTSEGILKHLANMNQGFV